MNEEGESSLRSLIVQYLLEHTECSGCGQRFDAGGLRIQAHRGHIWLTAARCSHCGWQGLIMASFRIEDHGECVDSATSSGESVVESAQPISGDDVIEFHTYLQQFRGSITEMLGIGDVPV